MTGLMMDLEMRSRLVAVWRQSPSRGSTSVLANTQPGVAIHLLILNVYKTIAKFFKFINVFFSYENQDHDGIQLHSHTDYRHT